MNRMTGGKLTYPEVADQTLRVGNKLRSCGVREGDHVMLFSPNHENYVAAVVGIMSIGAIPCLANPSYTGTAFLNRTLIGWTFWSSSNFLVPVNPTHTHIFLLLQNTS